MSEVPEEVPKEQHICVEFAQPTKEAAKPTAVLPVTEAISEESLHELTVPLEETSTELKIAFITDLMMSEKRQPSVSFSSHSKGRSG